MIIANGVGTELLFAELNDAVEALAGGRVVCLNAHVAPHKIPPGAIIYNQENVPLQVSTDMYQGHEIWDFSERNCEAWRAAGREVTHVPVGYHPSMERFTMRPWEERDIDVILTGVVNERRAKILEALAERGLNVVVIPPGIYGAERDEMLSRSKLSLGVLYYPDGVYGTLRAAHCAANKLPLVSEKAADTPGWVQWVTDYDRIVDEIADAVKNPKTLEHIARNAYSKFKQHSMALPEPKPDPWKRFRSSTPLCTWDVERTYEKARGSLVSPTPRVQIAVPFYRESWRVGKVVMTAIEGIVEDLEQHGIPADRVAIEGDSLICRMRQRVCHGFLKSNATHLLFCDGDIEALDPTCVRQMLASGHDIVAGAAPFKDLTGRVVCNVIPGTFDGDEIAMKHGCVEVRDAGSGFMLISRTALVKMMVAHPELLHWSLAAEDKGAPLWALFDTGIVDGVYHSEDYMFCRRWQKLGGKVYIYVPATFRHWGDFGYTASFCEQYGLTQRRA